MQIVSDKLCQAPQKDVRLNNLISYKHLTNDITTRANAGVLLKENEITRNFYIVGSRKACTFQRNLSHITTTFLNRDIVI